MPVIAPAPPSAAGRARRHPRAHRCRRGDRDRVDRRDAGRRPRVDGWPSSDDEELARRCRGTAGRSVRGAAVVARDRADRRSHPPALRDRRASRTERRRVPAMPARRGVRRRGRDAGPRCPWLRCVELPLRDAAPSDDGRHRRRVSPAVSVAGWPRSRRTAFPLEAAPVARRLGALGGARRGDPDAGAAADRHLHRYAACASSSPLQMQPIVERASAEMVATINAQIGTLLRAYIAEAIEREIEKWRKGNT